MKQIFTIFIIFWAGILHASSMNDTENRCKNGDVSQCEKACNLGGILGSCFMAGHLYEESGNVSRAMIYQEKTCSLGSSPMSLASCGMSGVKYSKKGEYKKAIPLLKKACYSKIPNEVALDSCSMLMLSYQAGYISDSFASTNKKIIDAFNNAGTRSCQLQKETGQVKIFKDSPISYCDYYSFLSYNINQQLVDKFNTYCKKLDATSCSNLMFIYAQGRGNITQDDEKSIYYGQKTCDIDKSKCKVFYEYKHAVLNPKPPVSSSSSNNSHSYSRPQAPVCRTVFHTEYAPGSRRRMVQIPKYVCN